MGQMKGMLDRYRTPETQKGFAEKHGQNPYVMASFADGSKLALEAAIMGNATGFVPQVRGMRGYPLAHVNDMLKAFSPDDFNREGFVEYSLGAAPHTGAWIVVHETNPAKKKTLGYLKLGDGPLYVLYTPYHLPHIQIASTIARAALINDPTTAPLGAPTAEVVTVAKRDLKAGEVLDGVGGFLSYGVIDNADAFLAEDLLAVGLSEGARLLRDVAKDQPIALRDVELPAGRLCDKLRAEQLAAFPSKGRPAQAVATAQLASP